MKSLDNLHSFPLTSSLGKTLVGPVVSTGAGVLLGLSFERQPLNF